MHTLWLSAFDGVGINPRGNTGTTVWRGRAKNCRVQPPEPPPRQFKHWIRMHETCLCIVEDEAEHTAHGGRQVLADVAAVQRLRLYEYVVKTNLHQQNIHAPAVRVAVSF